MLPIAASAYSEVLAAVMDANVSGREVPRATRVIAVMESSMDRMQPKRVANSPTIPVQRPMKARATTKAGFPPAIEGGGTRAKRTFQPMAIKCIMASVAETSSSTRLS